jgi:hypothetical protein
MSRRKYTCERNYLRVTLSSEILERLHDVGGNVVGGCSRVVEDCLRVCLPLYQSREPKNGVSADPIQSDLILSVLIPDILGRAIAVACHEVVEKDFKNLKGK